MSNFEDRSILVIFNSQSCGQNDATLKQINNWQEVESACYGADDVMSSSRQKLTDLGTVIVNDKSTAKDVFLRLRDMPGIKAAIPPSHCLNQHQW